MANIGGPLTPTLGRHTGLSRVCHSAFLNRRVRATIPVYPAERGLQALSLHQNLVNLGLLQRNTRETGSERRGRAAGTGRDSNPELSTVEGCAFPPSHGPGTWVNGQRSPVPRPGGQLSVLSLSACTPLCRSPSLFTRLLAQLVEQVSDSHTCTHSATGRASARRLPALPAAATAGIFPAGGDPEGWNWTTQTPGQVLGF